MKRKTLLITTMLALVVVTGVGASLFLVPSNIDPAHKFSWSENAGWMNWLDANATNDGVLVGRAVRVGANSPDRQRLVTVVHAEYDVCVANVDREEHGFA